MDINRNQYFMIGLVILFVGTEFRMIESVILNQETSQMITDKLDKISFTNNTASASMISTGTGLSAHRTVNPPEWIGWAFISVGAVFILHSLAMKRPG